MYLLENEHRLEIYDNDELYTKWRASIRGGITTRKKIHKR